MTACADRGVLRQVVRCLREDKDAWETHRASWDQETLSRHVQAAGCACVCLFHLVCFPNAEGVLPQCAEAALRAGAASQLHAAAVRYGAHRDFAFAVRAVRQLYESLLHCTVTCQLVLEKLDIGIDCECFPWSETPRLVMRHGREHLVAVDSAQGETVGGYVQCLRRGHACSCQDP